ESIELTAEDGRLVLTERATLGENFKYDLVGPAVRDSMLDLLPAESIASASISLNMEGIRQILIDAQKSLGPDLSDELDMPPLDAQIPGLGLSIDEALSAFSGEITAALIDMPDEDAQGPQRGVPEFVVALSTVDPAGKVYQDILKKKLLAVFNKGLRQELREETGISLVAKDNRLIFGSHGQAAILKAGKAPKPVGSDKRQLLAGGYMNLHVDAEPIAKAMEQEFVRNRRGQNHGFREEIAWLEGQLERPNLPAAEAQRLERHLAEMREELEHRSSNPRPIREEEQLILDAFERLEGLTLQATKEGETYLAEVALSLDDKKSNVLKQTGSFIGNFMDPAWRDPEMCPRIEAARKLAAKNPEAFRKSLIGTWSNEWEDEMEAPIEDSATNSSREEGEVPQPEPAPEPEIIHGVNKFVYNADGTSFLRFLTIESEGYYLDQNEGHWVVHGNTLLEYNEHGSVEWVGGMLSHGPKKQEYYYVSEAFEEYELDNMTRVPDDWQLPDPPKGLPKLENPVFEDPLWEMSGDTNESSDAVMPREMQREHEDHFRHGDDHGHESHGHDGDGHDGGSEFKTSPRAAPEREETITIEELLRRSQELEAEPEGIIDRASTTDTFVVQLAHFEIKGLVTNLSGTEKRHLAADLVIEGTNHRFRQIMAANDPFIRNEALKVLGGYSYEDAQQDGFLERVKIDVTKRLNDHLQQLNPSPVKWISELYFTKFVIQ
ncbi:MAG: flagellar basal body-associated FliL family protein, partial [Opitutales bacterium]